MHLKGCLLLTKQWYNVLGRLVAFLLLMAHFSTSLQMAPICGPQQVGDYIILLIVGVRGVHAK